VVDESTVSSLACGHRVLSVANLNEAVEEIEVSSSQGPTRDGRNKPDVAAPGTDIVAANGFAPDGAPFVAMTGTSMASPFVAGVAGLMLSANRTLTAAQIAGIVQSTAAPLPGSTFTWRNDAGFGVIDPEACLREATRIGKHKEVRP
jgi:subtilisin family serine protease